MGEAWRDSTVAFISTKGAEARMVQRIKEVSEREKRRNEFNRYKRAWMREWSRQPNPFIALAWWTSEAQRERRKAIYMEFDED